MLSDADDSLIASAKDNDVEGVIAALDNGADIDVKEGPFTGSALHIAASKGFLEIVKLLVERGADILLKGGADMTPIHLAARDGQTAVVKYLLDSSDEIPLRVINDILTVANMSVYGNPTIVEMLQKYRVFHARPSVEHLSEDDAKLVVAAHDGDLVIVKEALKDGANIEVIDGRGMTPLIWAALRSRTEIVEELIKQGADVNSTNRAGWTPLIQAAAQGNKEMVVFLIEHGAEVNKTTAFSETALMFAAMEGYTDVVRLLLKNGADPLIEAESDEEYSDVRETALIYAIRKGHKEIAAILREAMTN